MNLSSASGACGWSVALAAVTLLWSADANARNLSYRAPEDACPTREDVAAQIDARAPTGRDVTLDVERITATQFRGEVTLGGPGAERLTRAVEARSCSALIEALTLIIALDRVEGPSAPETAPDPAPPPASKPAPTPHLFHSGLDHDRDHSRDRTPSSKLGGTLAFGVAASTAVVPFQTTNMWLWSGGVFAELASSRPLAGTTWFRPAIRASFERSLPMVAAASDALVRPELVITTGALDLCPAELAGTIGFGVARTALCSRTQLGVIDARDNTDAASTQSRLWSTTGGLLRARIEIGASTNSNSVRPVFEVAMGVAAPLVRDRFQFPTRAEAIEAAGAMWVTSIGGGVVIP